MTNQLGLEHKAAAPKFGVRHLQCFLIFLGLALIFAVRVNLSIAIVAMTDKNSTNPNFPEYNWSLKIKSYVLSSFFWGYILPQIPSGYLARRFGGKIMLLLGALLSGIFAILTPLCADIGGWQLVCALRFAQGICQGVTFPSTHTILAKWAPPHERDTLGTYCYSGTHFGTVVMLACSGLLASSSLGWPSTFYIPGVLCILWVIVWIVWGAAAPDNYKGITPAERKYIEVSLNVNKVHAESRQSMKIPWRRILSSPPCWVLFLTHASFNFGFWTILTQIPTYMKHVLRQDIKSNALLSALPYAAMLLLGFVFCAISNVLAHYKCLTLSGSRKLFNSIGLWLPAVALLGFSYVTAEQSALAVALLVVIVGASSAIHLGFQVNHIDLSPNFAGLLMGISNTCANSMAILAPLVVGFVVTDVKDPAQWRIIFFIAAGYYFIGNLLFVLFGKTKVQPWNESTRSAQEVEFITTETNTEKAKV